jgi:tetratricopeptide (TPR) repeat protein
MRVAEKADPLSPEVHWLMGAVLISAGRYDEAASYCQKLPADDLNKPECMGRALLGQGGTNDAIQVLAAAPNPRYLGYAYGRAGRREDAEKLASTSTGALAQALIFAGLGDKERTMQAVERLATLGPVRLGRDLTYPEFALIRGDPRVKVLRKKVGLPD